LTPTSTPPLWTLTPVTGGNNPPANINPTAEFTDAEGWSCGDFPCQDDIEGFLARIRAPAGYEVSYVGTFPGQPMQIAYDSQGKLYATVLENGTRNGAVYVMDDGAVERYSDTFVSPIGLAFQPGTQILYISARIEPESGGGLWRVYPDRQSELVIDDLPCCFSVIDNQPNGMVFGPDGYLYLGVGSLTDHLEPPLPDRMPFAELQPYEASILRIQPHTGEIEVYAQGIRNPYDVTFDSAGQFYATDNGILEGPGDRLLRIDAGRHYGFPYWRTRGCADCPARDASWTISDDLFAFTDYTVPRGLVAYTGSQFPENIVDSVFVTLWHNTPNAQRVVRIDPKAIPTNPDRLAEYTPEPFVTGLIHPVAIVVAPDGSLVIADFIYGHIWRVSYIGDGAATTSSSQTSQIENPPATATAGSSLFITATPRP
jgi:hypothetical protein